MMSDTMVWLNTDNRCFLEDDATGLWGQAIQFLKCELWHPRLVFKDARFREEVGVVEILQQVLLRDWVRQHGIRLMGFHVQIKRRKIHVLFWEKKTGDKKKKIHYIWSCFHWGNESDKNQSGSAAKNTRTVSVWVYRTAGLDFKLHAVLD